MLLCKAIGILKKEIVDQRLRISVCRKVFGNTVKVRKIWNIVGQISTVHVTTKGKCIFRSARKKIFNMPQNAIQGRLTVFLQKEAEEVDAYDTARGDDRIDLPILQIATDRADGICI